MYLSLSIASTCEAHDGAAIRSDSGLLGNTYACASGSVWADNFSGGQKQRFHDPSPNLFGDRGRTARSNSTVGYSNSKGDSEEITTLTHNLIIPNFQAWFSQVFGAEIGAHMAQLYEESLPDFDAKFKESVERMVKNGQTAVSVTRFEGPELSEKDFYAVKLVKAMQNPVPIYGVKMNKPGETAWGIPGFFIFVQGTFRYLGWHAMRGVPNLLPKRIRVGGNVQKAKMVHMVMPVYPNEAKKQKIQGTEVLHTVIDYDRSILDLQWVSGPPELKDAVMDAVKQWRYETTLLNGEPVQVDTTISVVFTLGKK